MQFAPQSSRRGLRAVVAAKGGPVATPGRPTAPKCLTRPAGSARATVLTGNGWEPTDRRCGPRAHRDGRRR